MENDQHNIFPKIQNDKGSYDMVLPVPTPAGTALTMSSSHRKFTDYNSCKIEVNSEEELVKELNFKDAKVKYARMIELRDGTLGKKFKSINFNYISTFRERLLPPEEALPTLKTDLYGTVNSIENSPVKFSKNFKSPLFKTFGTKKKTLNLGNRETNLILKESFDPVYAFKKQAEINRAYEEETKTKIRRLEQLIRQLELKDENLSNHLVNLNYESADLMKEIKSIEILREKKQMQIENKKRKMKDLRDLKQANSIHLNIELNRELAKYDASIHESKTKLENLLSNVNDKKNKLKSEIEALEKDIEKADFQRLALTEDLSLHFHNILKAGVDVRNEGLSWVIKEIFMLGEDVSLSYLPDYLDDESINFLFKIAKLGMELKVLEKELISLKEDIYTENLEHLNKRKQVFNPSPTKKLFQNVHRRSLSKPEANCFPVFHKFSELKQHIESGDKVSNKSNKLVMTVCKINELKRSVNAECHRLTELELNRIYRLLYSQNYERKYNTTKEKVFQALLGNDKTLRATYQYELELSVSNIINTYKPLEVSRSYKRC